jgi:hypothetical protein
MEKNDKSASNSKSKTAHKEKLNDVVEVKTETIVKEEENENYLGKKRTPNDQEE